MESHTLKTTGVSKDLLWSLDEHIRELLPRLTIQNSVDFLRLLPPPPDEAPFEPAVHNSNGPQSR